MKARLKWYRRLYWWWKVRSYELDAEKTQTFWEWLNIHDMHLAKWELVDGPEPGDVMGRTDHHHELIPLDMEETEAILNRYLRNIKKAYGDPHAGTGENQ